MLEIHHASFFHQGAGAVGIRFLFGQFGIFRMRRTHVVVFGRDTAVAIAKLKADVVIDGHLQRLADALIRVRVLAIHFSELVWAHHDGGHGNNFGFHKAERVHHVDEFPNGFIEHVNFFGFQCGQPR